MTATVVQVVVVEDSPVVRDLLINILDSDAGITVVGSAGSGQEALDLLEHQTPHVITMDITMPGMDGFEATRRIMTSRPVPIVIVSAAWNAAEAAMTFRALEAGAVAVIEKPRGPGHPEAEAMARKLVQTVKLMSEVRVVRRWSKAAPGSSTARSAPTSTAAPATEIKVVAIGASTGGPPALQTLLAALSPQLGVPVVIVQHIAAGFLQGLVDWLGQTTGKPVQIAADGETALAGHIYLAPDGSHLGVSLTPDGLRLDLSRKPAENGLRPAVAHLFRSVAESCGANCAAVLLTGMGRDGATELGLVKAGGGVTIAQDAASSVVHGMPGEAIRLGAASHILPPLRIAGLLNSCCAANLTRTSGAPMRQPLKGTSHDEH